MRINNDERSRLFGKPCTPANHRLYATPWGIRVQVHRLIAVRFAAACTAAHRESRWRPQRIDGYNCRTIRGSDSSSIHAWAMAWDFFATPPNVPPPGGVWTPDDPPDAKFVAAFTTRGFTWGGTFKRRDTPHIEWASLPPGIDPPPVAPTTPPQPERWVPFMRQTQRFVSILLGPDGIGWAPTDLDFDSVGAVTPQAPFVDRDGKRKLPRAGKTNDNGRAFLYVDGTGTDLGGTTVGVWVTVAEA